MPRNIRAYQRDYMKQRRESEKTAPKAAQIVAEMQAQYEKSKKRLESALETTTPGTSAFLRYSEALDDLARKHRQELVERGVQPESLGTAARPSWNFVCHISAQGTPTVVEVPAENVPAVLAERTRRDSERIAKNTKPGDDEVRAALDAEFGFSGEKE